MNLSSFNALTASPGPASSVAKAQENAQARLDTAGRGAEDFSAYLTKALRPQSERWVDNTQRQGIADHLGSHRPGAETGSDTAEVPKRPDDTADRGDQPRNTTSNARHRQDNHEASTATHLKSAAQELAHRSRQSQAARWSAPGSPQEPAKSVRTSHSAASRQVDGAQTSPSPASDDNHPAEKTQESASDTSKVTESMGATAQPAASPDNSGTVPQGSVANADTGLHTLTLSARMQIVTPQQGAVSEQSLQDFARSMGFNDAQVQQLMGGSALTSASADQAPLDVLLPGSPAAANANQTALLNALNQTLPEGFQIEDLQLEVMSVRGDARSGPLTDGPSTLSVLTMMDADLGPGSAEASADTPAGQFQDSPSEQSAYGHSAQSLAGNARANASATGISPSHPHTAETYDKLSARLATEMAARMNEQINQGEWKMRFALKPANLGTVDVQLEMRDGKLAAVLQADNPLTQDLLQNGSQRLRDALNQMGLTQSSVQFGLGQGQGQRGERDSARTTTASVGRTGSDTADNASAQVTSASRRNSLSQLDFYA